MSRIRSIHPRIFTDEHYVALSIYARELLKGLWCEAWDDGVIEWRPLRLKMRIFPLDQVDVEALLAELVREKFIMPFTAGSKEYAVIRNFRKWQKPKKPSASGVLPLSLVEYIGLKKGAFLGKVLGEEEDEAEGANPTPEAKVPTLFSTGVAPVENQFGTGGVNPRQKGGREEGRKVLEGSLRSPSPCAAPESGTVAAPPPGRESASQDPFDGFWGALPTEARTAPDFARKAYAKALTLGATPERILAALRRELGRAGGKLGLSPAGWLKGGSWRVEEAQAEPSRAARPVDCWAGWEIADHMALGEWNSARDSGVWMTRDASRNKLSVADRRADLWESIQRRSQRAAAHIRAIDAALLPVEVAA